jgi:parallel beta-helix repeat protein
VRIPALVGAVGVGTALVVGASAGGASISRATVACGATITSSTTLTSDLSCSGTDGIDIGAAGVTLNLNGHSISGNGTSSTHGVDVAGKKSVTVKNGYITGFPAGVFFESGSDGGHITGIIAGGGSTGIVAITSDGLVVSGNDVGGSTNPGYSIQGGSGVKIMGNIAEQNGTAGFLILAGTAFTISGNKALNNGSTGFFISGTKGTVSGNVADGNAADGFQLDSPGLGPKSGLTAAKNRAAFNGGYGFDVSMFGALDGGGNTVQRNGNAAECLSIACVEVSG